MLKFTTTLIIAMLGAWLAGPPSAGTATYVETIKLNIQLPPGQEALAAQLPKERKADKILHFTPEVALFMDPPADEEGEGGGNWSGSDGGVQMNIVMSAPENKLFTDLQEGSKVEKRDFMGRIFLIRDKVETLSWKLTGKQKIIMDYPCQQAMAMRDSTPIEAWFAPQIPVSTGPAGYGGLPGLIMELSIDEGDRTYSLKSLDMVAPDTELLVPPKKGKKVSQAEFDKIQAEKMKEMEMENGGSGTMIKVIRR